MSYYNQQQPPVGVPPPQGYPPEGYPKDAYPPPGYPPQGYPQGYPPQGYPPPYAPQYPAQPPPQQQQSTGFLEGCSNLDTNKTKHPYGTRTMTKDMDQILEKLEQLQREMQDKLQLQMQEQLAKIQQDMIDRMMESHQNMMTQLTQLLAGGINKGKSLIDNVRESNQYPPGFTPTQAFMKQYSHVIEMTPDRITLQNMEKRSSESFRQYAQRWIEIAMQVQPPLLEREITMLFINTLKSPFINYILGSVTNSFSDIVMSGEMIEDAVRSGKIDAGESVKRSALRKKKNKVNNVRAYSKGYSKQVTVGSPMTTTTNLQAPSRNESNQRTNTEKLQFTPIPITYQELYQRLVDEHVVSPFYLTPLQPPYPKWYDANAQCDYHAGVSGHSIENCTSFKKVVERLIKMGIVKVVDISNVDNPRPNHTDVGVNAIEGKNIEEMLKNVHINAVHEEITERGTLSDICPYEPGSVLNNWTAEEIPVVFRAYLE